MRVRFCVGTKQRAAAAAAAAFGLGEKDLLPAQLLTGNKPKTLGRFLFFPLIPSIRDS